MNQPEQKIESLSHTSDMIITNLSLLQNMFPEKEKIIRAYHRYFLEQKFTQDMQMIDHFIGFLDMHFIDQIADQITFSSQKIQHFLSLYGRDRNKKNL